MQVKLAVLVDVFEDASGLKQCTLDKVQVLQWVLLFGLFTIVVAPAHVVGAPLFPPRLLCLHEIDVSLELLLSQSV